MQFSGERIVFSTNYMGTTGYTHAKNESRHRSYIIQKKKNSKYTSEI